jgi:hypothetical protein
MVGRADRRDERRQRDGARLELADLLEPGGRTAPVVLEALEIRRSRYSMFWQEYTTEAPVARAAASAISTRNGCSRMITSTPLDSRCAQTERTTIGSPAARRPRSTSS